jgi:parallel beta-helix repeat protein
MSAIRVAAAGTVLALAFLLLSCGGAVARTHSPGLATVAQAPCALVASPSGSDRARGTASRPLQSVQHLLNRLAPGQTGCLRGGIYREAVKVNRGGSGPRSRVTLTSYPGERATLVGRLYLTRRASYVTIADLNLNGRNREGLPSPDIASLGATFVGDDVTNEHTEICFILGSEFYGRAINTLIQGNRIHDCGVEPSTNEDHGIYVAVADNAHILDNVIYKNTDRGIQIYPDAQGTVVEHNIIDHNGEAIAFGGEHTTSNNSTVAFNLITNSTLGPDISSFFPRDTPVGVNNVVHDNCIFGGAHGTVNRPFGFSVAATKAVNPRYASPASGNYSVPGGNPCAAYVLPGTPVAPF